MDQFILEDYEKKMNGAIDNLINNFSGIRSGRASTTLVDSIVVDAYGQNMKIKDLASVSVPEARTIKIWKRYFRGSIFQERDGNIK